MTTDKYILDGHRPIIEKDLLTWGKWIETADRKVARTEIGQVKISTVFLGLDHQFGEGEPLLFETMVFGGKYDQEQERYSTWDEAEKGHKKWVKKVEGKK
ncbi:MAG: hypothetical protein MUP81_03235 [Dehalococcoidia bacterium]|nr:hypothetical protein [Dehalococcoidia bacterium]